MFLKLLIESFVAFLAIDLVWITQVASPWMKRATPHLLAPSPNLWAALLFYVIYLASLIYLIIMPGLTQKIGPQTLALQSFIFGVAAYSTYDLTNLAILKNYPWTMALADIIWGGLLTMVTTLIIYQLNS